MFLRERKGFPAVLEVCSLLFINSWSDDTFVLAAWVKESSWWLWDWGDSSDTTDVTGDWDQTHISMRRSPWSSSRTLRLAERATFKGVIYWITTFLCALQGKWILLYGPFKILLIISGCAFLVNQSHVLGVSSVMLCQLCYRNTKL